MSSRACPVCGEPFDANAQRCYRCQTTLGAWWPLEDALDRLAGAAAPRGATRGGFLRIGVPALAAGVMIGALLWPDAQGPTVPPQQTSSDATKPQAEPVRAPPPPEPLMYRVQPGDTLWRIAAGLSGDGRNWPRIWPDRIANPALRPGATLRIPQTALAITPRVAKGVQ